jgi:hypothetical protein
MKKLIFYTSHIYLLFRCHENIVVLHKTFILYCRLILLNLKEKKHVFLSIMPVSFATLKSFCHSSSLLNTAPCYDACRRSASVLFCTGNVPFFQQFIHNTLQHLILNTHISSDLMLTHNIHYDKGLIIRWMGPIMVQPWT